jgi:hypothetical protein
VLTIEAYFQALTFAQSTYGYADASGTPTANISVSLKHFDEHLNTFIGQLQAAKVWEKTLLIVGS